jgi:hypothetical protein
MRQISALPVLFLLACAGSSDSPREASVSLPVGAESQPAPSPSSLAGWTLLPTDVFQEPRALHVTQIASYPAEGAEASTDLTWAPEAVGGFEGTSELYLQTRGRRVFAAGWAADGIETPLVGALRTDDSLLAWVWRPDVVTLIVSRHHPRTGRRLADAVAVRGQPPHLVDRPQRLYATRPVPVLGRGERLAFALHQGDHRALLFDELGEPGSVVTVSGHPTFDVASQGSPKVFRWVDGTLAP